MQVQERRGDELEKNFVLEPMASPFVRLSSEEMNIPARHGDNAILKPTNVTEMFRLEHEVGVNQERLSPLRRAVTYPSTLWSNRIVISTSYRPAPRFMTRRSVAYASPLLPVLTSYLC